ncbi:MAG: acylneuraminate cytidylyltransferase family protein [Alphaproteobacteria bacterium]
MASTDSKPLIAIIPARAGSKGLPNKNTMIFGAHPLYMHAVKVAIEANCDRCIISTNIHSILEATHSKTVETIKRPTAFTKDTTKMDDVLCHLVDTVIDGDATIILLQPTSPLRNTHDLLNALQRYSDGNFDLVMTVTEAENHALKYGFVVGNHFKPVSKPEYCFQNRADLPKLFKPNGAIYIFAADWLRENRTLATDNIGFSIMPVERSADIDTKHDLDAAMRRLAQTN